jgi:hypothetical protein
MAVVTFSRALCLSLLAGACVVVTARPLPQQPAHFAAAEPDDDPGALVGELVFQADLMSALDRLCPRNAGNTDWHAALTALERQAMTPELLDLSRRLGADAGSQLVRERGGCATSGFAAAYAESRLEFNSLLKRWNER